jgi:hypothetical protein
MSIKINRLEEGHNSYPIGMPTTCWNSVPPKETNMLSMRNFLDNLKSRSFSQVSSIKTFDFSTLYTTLPHDKLQTRLKETIHKAFSHRNYGSNFVVLGYNSTYFSNFEETPTRMSIKINRLEEGHNSYPLVCRRPAETVSLQRRQICYRYQ